MNGSSRRAELMSRISKAILLVSSLQRPSTIELFDVRASVAGRRPITDCAAHSEPPLDPAAKFLQASCWLRVMPAQVPLTRYAGFGILTTTVAIYIFLVVVS